MQLMTELKGIELKFKTSDQLFSPRQIDLGTQSLLSTVSFQPDDKVLDLGCGYGVVGILAAKLIGPDQVVMVDVDSRAVTMARQNADLNGFRDQLRIFVSDGLAGIEDNDFTLILSNPPYHADFSVPRRFIELGFEKLQLGGKMVMVVKRLKWYQNKLTSIFGGVGVQQLNGYYVLTAEKRSSQPPKNQSKEQKMTRKHARRQKRARRNKRQSKN